MEKSVIDINKNAKIGVVKLDDTIFGIKPNDHAIYLDVVSYMKSMRQGTSKVKNRSDIKGSTKKIKKQKGTGTARMGNIKSPILRGGGVAFGPSPRSYKIKLNKSVKRLARKSALSYKFKEDNMIIVDDFTFETPSTKKMINLLGNIGFTDKKTLIITDSNNKKLYLSSRNLKKHKVLNYSELNSYHILNVDKLIFLKSSLEKLNSIF